MSLRSHMPSSRSMAMGRRSARCNAQVAFEKYQGLGNNFILVDNRSEKEPFVSATEAPRWCDVCFGVGADGIIFALPAEGDTDFSMRIFNSDGSEPEMCGNGIRCLAKFVADSDGVESAKYKVHTLAGLIVPELQSDGRVRVDMGEPILGGPDVPTTLPTNEAGHVVKAPLEVAGESWTVTAVSMGNPHAVVYSRKDSNVVVDDVDLEAIGPLFEANGVFPARTNTEFVEVISPTHVKMSVWERGAGRTLACGTGACALVVAGILEGRLDRGAPCRVDLPGGPLEIEWDEQSNHIFMTGAAERVFKGTWAVEAP